MVGQHPQAMEKIHHKYIFHEYLSKTVYIFRSLATGERKKVVCFVRKAGKPWLEAVVVEMEILSLLIRLIFLRARAAVSW